MNKIDAVILSLTDRGKQLNLTTGPTFRYVLIRDTESFVGRLSSQLVSVSMT